MLCLHTIKTKKCTVASRYPPAHSLTRLRHLSCASGYVDDTSVLERQIILLFQARLARLILVRTGTRTENECRNNSIAGTYSQYIYFYPRTLSALPHDHLPTLEPGTRSRISARFMAPGHEPPRARRGGASRARGHSPCPSGDVCAEPLRLEGSPETRRVLSSGAGLSRNGTCSGGGIGRKIRAGRTTVKYFRLGRTRVCILSLIHI